MNKSVNIRITRFAYVVFCKFHTKTHKTIPYYDYRTSRHQMKSQTKTVGVNIV